MKGCSIMIEVIAKHPQCKEAKKDPIYLQLKTRTANDIIDLLEEITNRLQQEDQELKETLEKYPPVDNISESTTSTDTESLLNVLPSVPTHIPTMNEQKLSPNNNNCPFMSSPVMQMPEPKPVFPLGIQLPTPLKTFSLPPTFIVEPRQLASWIVKRNDGQEQPSVLILDIRPRQIFNQGFIKHKWVAQIEPLTLRPNILSSKVEESMMMNPEAEQIIFAARHQFDIVVYYDQNSYTMNNNSLRYLTESIYELEFQKILQRAPIMLAGGFDAWRSIIGDKGIFRYNRQESNSVKKEKQVDIELTPVKVHHTVYDYFSSTTTGTSPKTKESMAHHQNPPLRGIFGTSTTFFEPSTSPHSMPIPQPQSTTTIPPLRPLTRKNTFIDNPFHGFTTTTNKKFDIPPKPQRPLPPIPTSSTNHTIMGMAGLTNLGNTCFMNSILQCLSGTIPFARYFISGNYKKQGHNGILTKAFTDLLRQMWSRFQKETVTTKFFHNTLYHLSDQFNDFQQHDAQEFMIFVLSTLHEECKDKPLKVPTYEELDAQYGDGWLDKLPDWQASAWSWERSLALNSSIIVSLFQGQFRSRLQCLTCGSESTTYNDFMSLLLPIPLESSTHKLTIYDCLDEFSKKETLGESNEWRCSRCKAMRTATKQLTLSKLPDVLLVTLGRFKKEGMFSNKLDNDVDYPMVGLDLSKYVPYTMFPPNKPPEKSTFQYDLYAVSNHMGTSNGGHYTAFVRNGYEWYEFNDTKVQKIENSQVVTKAAYNLFYVRSTVK
ncbi:uncharacterized protein BX663DRAFT_532037 [Cokeromyces recurvatus]|uniref:uncharacterized protein n=1 Tax=Cokeromyces recurvatus TaxID=90255 RepID=UPI0022206F23|nr:uncharacterized protein BX663DRAFT_532037 [Cokeromyces recurvatus]KAI7900888.1 hypothetical protein BX663DRAFT_532037 [Cokeromyces recurvatus]